MTVNIQLPDLSTPTADMATLADEYRKQRQNTLALCAPLQAEDYGLQTAVFASPPRRHLGHTTWFLKPLFCVSLSLTISRCICFITRCSIPITRGLAIRFRAQCEARCRDRPMPKCWRIVIRLTNHC